MVEQANRHGWRKALRVSLTAIVCIALLGGAAVALWRIYSSEPTAERGGATRKSAALVETIEVERGAYQPEIVVLGRVEAARHITLSPRVAGQILELDPKFEPGEIVRQGQAMLTIDPADFRNLLAMRKSELEQARAELAIEQGRVDVAKKEFQLLGETVDPSNRSLVLREPQIQASRARVHSAEAAVEQAELDLERTKIIAPFDAKILRRDVNVGSQVSPGEPLARLVGIDEYWVVATVPLRHLRWLRFADENGEGSTVRIRHPGPWGPGVTREGRVTRMIGSVDDQTRLASVLVTVEDPLALQTDAPPMILGTLVELSIAGREIDDIARLNRDYVREGDTVWVMADGKLQIRDAEVVFRDAQYAYVRSGLQSGDHVVRTTLATVAEGIPLRRAAEEATTARRTAP